MHDEVTKPTKLIEVFFSYSHKDEKMRKRLEAHLSTLKRQNVISGWHDRKIEPGTEWKGQIDEHLDKAEIVLLLISADFLASDYCYDVELNQALARHSAGQTRVIPIILRPCDWTSTRFGKLQALPRDGKPVCNYPTHDHAFNEIVRGISRIVQELSTSAMDSSVSHQEQVQPNAIVHPEIDPNNVHISRGILDILERMRIINAIAKTDEDALFDDKLMSEYRTLLEEMVETFMPIVKLLVKAGLITMDINIEDIKDIDRYSTLSGEPTAVFDNGNIWIDSEYSGGILRKPASKDGVSIKL